MRLKRLVASVSAGFEDFVSRVENHEAVADCMIDEVRKAAARVKVQSARAQSQIQRLEARCRELGADEARWNDRALAVSGADDDRTEARALECVRRARQAAQQKAALEAQLVEHRTLADDLKRRLLDLERRLGDLTMKKTALSSRSARAQTLRHVRSDDCASIDAVFDRWETAVLTDEYREDVTDDAGDTLDREFRDDEEADDLRARLAELRAGQHRNAGEQS